MRKENATPRHPLAKRQVPVVLALLLAHCKTDPTNGRAIYADGWNDERVVREAEAINPDPAKPIGLASVKGWRSDLYGHVRNFRSKAERPTKRDMAAELEKMRDEFAAMHERVDAVVAWAQHLSQFLQASRGYTPPTGRPQSRPPSPNGGG